MCNPAIIPYALAVVGAGLSYKDSKDKQQDMKRAQRRETDRQTTLNKESEGALRKNQDSYEREDLEAAMAAASGERQAQYAAAEASAPRTFEEAPGSAATSNQVIQGAFDRALGDARADAANRGRLGADLASFGDALGVKAIENNRRSGEIGMIGSFIRGGANVLPLELNSIATRQTGTGTAGSMLSAFGSAAMSGAGTSGAGGAQVGTKTGGNTKAAVDFSKIFGKG